MADHLTLDINLNEGTTSSSGSLFGSSSGNKESGGVLSSIRSGYKGAKSALNSTGVALVAGSVINYETSRVGITTGNYQRQQEINAAKTVGGQLLGVAAGFVVGGFGGGMLAGAAVGLNYYQAYDSYNFSRRAEAATLAIRREREGLISSSRSRGAIQ